jgi:hypothetical protein
MELLTFSLHRDDGADQADAVTPSPAKNAGSAANKYVFEMRLFFSSDDLVVEGLLLCSSPKVQAKILKNRSKFIHNSQKCKICTFFSPGPPDYLHERRQANVCIHPNTQQQTGNSFVSRNRSQRIQSNQTSPPAPAIASAQAAAANRIVN